MRRTIAKIKTLHPGGALAVVSDDVGILEDLPAWCRGQGHELLELKEIAPGEYRGLVRKKS